MSGTVTLDATTIEAIARRVVELLREEPVPADEAIDAAEVARRFGVSRDYVYQHADDLGAVRLGSGPRARLRFDLATVADRLTCCSTSRESERDENRSAKPKAPHRRRRASGAERDLLPITPPRVPR